MGKSFRKQEEQTLSEVDKGATETLNEGQSNAAIQASLAGPMARTEASTAEVGPWQSGLQPNALNGEMSTAEFNAVTSPSGNNEVSFRDTTATAGASGTAQVSTQSGSSKSTPLTLSQSSSVSENTVTVDESATVAANQDLLRNALVDREVALEEKRSALEQARSTGDSSRTATLEAEVTAQGAALGELRQKIDSASSLADIEAAAGAAGVDTAKLETVDRVTDGISVSSTSSAGLNSSGFASTDSATVELTSNDGASATTHSRTDTTAVGVSGGELSAKRGRNVSHAERTGDLTQTDTVDNAMQGSFGDNGVQLSGKRTETTTLSDSDGAAVAHQQSTAVGGGFDGKTLSGDLSTSTTTLGGATVETKGGAHIDEDSVGLQATRSGTQKDGDDAVGYSFGGVFNLTFRVDPVPNTNPPRFASHFKVMGGGSVGGSASTQGAHKASGASGEASIGASASAAVELSHTQMLSDEEVSAYHLELSEWETTGKAPSGLPAFGIDRLRALAAELSDPGAALALFSAEQAAGMDTGESLALNLDGQFGVNAGAGGKMGGFGASGAASWSGSVGRDFQVSKTAGGLVQVSLSFESAEEIAGKLGVSVQLVSASLGGSSANSEGYSATFLLDPNASAYSYNSVYSQLTGCLSSSDLRALAEDPALREAGAVKASSRKSTDSESMSGAVGNQLGTVGFSNSSAGSAAVTEADGNVSGVFTGSNTSSVDLSSGPLQLGLESKGEAEVAVSSNGDLTASFTDTQTATLPTLNPSWTLSALFKAAYPDRTQIDLSDGDMQTLLARAGGDTTPWRNCCHSTYNKSRGGTTTYDAWTALQWRLANPVPDPLYAETQPEVAVRLTQAAAIAEFMRWPDAQQAVYNLCNEYGASLHSDARNLGVQSEWPSALSDQRNRLDGATKRLTDLPNQLSADENDIANGYIRGAERCRSIRTDLTTVRQAIEQNISTFDNQATAVEMMARVDRQLVDLEAHESDFANNFDFGDSSIDGSSDVDVQPLQSAPDMTEVTILESKLSTFVSQEDALFAQMRSNITSEAEGGMARFWTTLTGNFNDVHEAYDQLTNLYEGWKYTVIDLRKAYQVAGVAGNWKVSEDNKGARTELEPDVESFRQIYTAAADQFTNIAHNLDKAMVWANKYERY